MGAWWPPTHEIADLLQAIGNGQSPEPGFAEGLRVQRVLEAVESSAADNSRWRHVEE